MYGVKLAFVAAVQNSLSTNVLPILAWAAGAQCLFLTTLRLNVDVRLADKDSRVVLSEKLGWITW